MYDNKEDNKVLQGAMIHEHTGRRLSFPRVSTLDAGCGCRRVRAGCKVSSRETRHGPGGAVSGQRVVSFIASR